jgi:hypothetical protein
MPTARFGNGLIGMRRTISQAEAVVVAHVGRLMSVNRQSNDIQ